MKKFIEKLGPLYVFVVSFVLVTAKLYIDQLMDGTIRLDSGIVGNVAILCALGAVAGLIVDGIGFGICACLDWAGKKGIFDLSSWHG